MIRRFCFGNPIETEAILEKPQADNWKREGKLLEKEGNQFRYPLSEGDIVYGLGENVRGINKRGWIYVSSCSDNAHHREDTRSLYGAHNFLLVDGTFCFGIFIDTPGKVTFDIGYSSYDWMTIEADSQDFELYLIEDNTPDEVTAAFRRMIGTSYIPPKWAFGYGQSRWGYKTEEDVREVARMHRENQLPLDSIYLDIDYMEAYKDFTIDRTAFPHFEELVQEMRSQDIRLVPIIDAGIKVEEGYPVYEEGREKGYFCKDSEGEDFVVGVWPGRCVLPDVLMEEAGEWFGDQYTFLLDKGIEGFWNDMNEPAIFYSEKRLQRLSEALDAYKNQNLDINTFFEWQGIVTGIANNEEDYQSFFHHYRGELIRHDKVHNLFGYFMTRSAGKAFERLCPDKRILLFSRASYIGMHRYGGIWMGDNCSWWSHLELNLKMLPSLNMCGFLFVGADVGGFGGDTTQDLLLRWLAFAIFVPLLRNHSAHNTRVQEVYRFEAMDAFRGILKLRYRLLPYLYSEFMKAVLHDAMYARPLGFVYTNDKLARETEDQLLIGDSIMIAPVIRPNATGRTVYCPEEMKCLHFREGVLTEEVVLPKGIHEVSTDLDEVTIYIRKGCVLPISKGGISVEKTDFDDLELLHFAQPGATYTYYQDNGTEKNPVWEEHVRELIVP
jgi:alpha-glucosidase